LTTLALPRDDAALRDRSFEATALGPAILDWLNWLDVGGKAERTLDQYERDLAKLALAFPAKGIADVTDGDLLRVLASWRNSATRRTRKEAYRSFFKWALRQRLIERNPVELLPDIARSKQKVYDIFTDAEIDDLLALPLIDSALMALLFKAGLRKSEARALQVRRLRLEPVAEVIILAGKGGKDRQIRMVASLKDELEHLLLLERLGPHDHLWYSKPGGGRIQRTDPVVDSSFDRWWRRCLEAADVRYRNPHMARHTFATRWLRAGGRLETLSRAMGHSSLAITFDLYGHLDESDMALDIVLMESL
jgi:integrase